MSIHRSNCPIYTLSIHHHNHRNCEQYKTVSLFHVQLRYFSFCYVQYIRTDEAVQMCVCVCAQQLILIASSPTTTKLIIIDTNKMISSYAYTHMAGIKDRKYLRTPHFNHTHTTQPHNSQDCINNSCKIKMRSNHITKEISTNVKMNI